MPPQVRWHPRRLLDARLWLALMSTPSSFLLTVSLIATLAAKLTQLAGIEDTHVDGLTRLSVCAPDAVVLSGLGALLGAGERLATERALGVLKWASRTLAFVVFIFVLFNVAYMSVTGDQLTASVIVMGWHRLHDAYGILVEELRRHELQIGAAVVLLIALPWIAQRVLARSTAAEHTPNPAWPLLAFCLCAGLGWALLPAPNSLPVARLTRSALLASYLTWMESSMSAPPGPEVAAALRPEPLVESEKQNPTTRYNVILIAIESLRHDFTSLSKTARVQTPNLAALAERGAFSDSASTPVPHTTKALFASHCGRMPFWQSTPHEFSELLQVQCFPQLLGNQGYATAFLQSAIGAFEERPRLVHRLGFTHFEAWENIGAEPLGYLASDDLPLVTAFDHFLDSLPSDRPFVTTLLTSATHHPYRLPQAELERLQAEGVATDTLKAEERYGKLVARADQLVGKVVESIERRGLRERTLIVVFGDHGEGFGEKGVRQHDNNYYEESLRVPLIIAGPGVRAQRMADDVSVLDIAPTVLDLLGFDIVKRNDSLYGRNALTQYSGPRSEYFSCFYDGVCYGLVRGDRKIVYLPELKRGLRFDLRADPGENHVLPVPDGAPELAELAQLVPRLQLTNMQPYVADLKFDNGWFCPASDDCRHPKTPPGLFFTPAIPEQCVKVKPSAVSKQAGYDHRVSLHNVCSGSMVCQVSYAADSHGSETVKLQPDESRELELAHHARSADLKYRVECQFL